MAFVVGGVISPLWSGEFFSLPKKGTAPHWFISVWSGKYAQQQRQHLGFTNICLFIIMRCILFIPTPFSSSVGQTQFTSEIREGFSNLAIKVKLQKHSSIEDVLEATFEHFRGILKTHPSPNIRARCVQSHIHSTLYVLYIPWLQPSRPVFCRLERSFTCVLHAGLKTGNHLKNLSSK